MKEKFLYSIIIVTYNRLELLKECIDHAVKQTIQPQKIIIIDNCSTDGTKKFLIENYYNNENFCIVHETENRGGSGGFCRGLHLAMETNSDWFMLIDDDAILNYDCMERLSPLQGDNKSLAYASVVVQDKRIDVSHRRTFDDSIKLCEYEKSEFLCDVATFCGLMVSRILVEKIGYPISEYFIWGDDTEYCFRISKYTHIVVYTDAILNHKVKTLINTGKRPEISWKNYYGTRNIIDMLIRHKKWRKLIINLVNTFRILLIKTIRSIGTIDKYVYERNLFFDAIKDGICRKLGKNPKYLPGVKK